MPTLHICFFAQLPELGVLVTFPRKREEQFREGEVVGALFGLGAIRAREGAELRSARRDRHETLVKGIEVDAVGKARVTNFDRVEHPKVLRWERRGMSGERGQKWECAASATHLELVQDKP